MLGKPPALQRGNPRRPGSTSKGAVSAREGFEHPPWKLMAGPDVKQDSPLVSFKFHLVWINAVPCKLGHLTVCPGSEPT